MTLPLQVTYRELDSLTPFTRNARTHSDEQVRQIADSIKEFGFTSPVLISPGNTIVAGHGRVMAARRSTVIHEDRPSRSELHPTMKPVALVQRMVEASTLEEQLVFDPFAGSGTTLITAEKTNRRAFVLELDPRYADVIIRRWQEFTGREARHASGQSFAALERLPAHKTQ